MGYTFCFSHIHQICNNSLLVKCNHDNFVFSFEVLPSVVAGKTSRSGSTVIWCEADANPPANISWLDPQENYIFTETTTVSKGRGSPGYGNLTRSQLTVDLTNASNSDVYTCIAYNGIGRANTSIPLFPSDIKRKHQLATCKLVCYRSNYKHRIMC